MQVKGKNEREVQWEGGIGMEKGENQNTSNNWKMEDKQEQKENRKKLSERGKKWDRVRKKEVY